jgi:hypothetical protein
LAASKIFAKPAEYRHRAVVGAITSNGRSATPQYHEVGHPPQSRGGGCCAQWQDPNGGSPAPLPTIGGGVSFLAACVRDARPCRFACHARSAIPQVASTARPQIATLIWQRPRTSLRNSKPPPRDGISPSSVIAQLKMLHALWALGEHGSVGGQCSEQDPITSNHLSH